MMPKLVVFFLTLNTCFFAFAQKGKLSGTIYGAAGKAPLAFVSVVINETKAGTVTDIDGKFYFLQFPENATLTISYVGYKTKVIILKEAELSIYIEMEQTSNELETIIIGNGESPANRIIKSAIENKKKNNPDFKSSYKYNAYNVSALGAGNNLFSPGKPDSNGKQKNKSLKEKDKKADSISANIREKFKQNYLMVTESYIEHIFSFPNKVKETVLASKVSGFKAAPFAITPSNFQPLAFYSDYILIANTSFVNPLINGSLAMYRFKLKNTVININDTTFIISFEPKKNKNFNGLKGLLYISSDGYAVENVIADAAEEKGVVFKFRLQQKYERVQAQWFPQQLNITIAQVSLKSDSVLTYWDSRTYITNVIIDSTFSRAAFSDIVQEFDLTAGKKTNKEWEQYRYDSLSPKEIMTYKNYDSLPVKALSRLNKVNNIINVLALSAIPWGKIDIPFKYLTNGINQYESFRLGAGFETNPLFNKFITLGAFAGYGVADKAWKYGGNIGFNLHHRTYTKLRLSYDQNLEEPGNVDYFEKNVVLKYSQTARNFLAARMDSVARIKIDFTTKILPSLQTNIWLLNEHRSPAGYAYLFENTAAEIKRKYINTEIGIGIRFVKGESFLRLGRAKIQKSWPGTYILLQASKSFKQLLNGELSYTKAAIEWGHIFKSKWFGQTTVLAQAGKIWGNTPYAYLFNTTASLSGRAVSIYIPKTFQTVGVYEFVASSSAAIFIEHNFSTLLFKPKHLSFRPSFLFIQNVGYGSLENAFAQKIIVLKTPYKGLFESGVLVKNLYRRSLGNFIYVGLSAGVFYRYGYYSLPKKADNRAFKAGLHLSF